MQARKMSVMIAAAAVLGAGVLCADEMTMRPGEYEMTTQVHMDGMNQEIPPTTIRHCLTANDVKDWKKIAEQNQRKGSDCEIHDMKMSGDHGSWSMTCKSGMKGTVEMSHSADGYEMTMNMENPGGPHPMKMKMHTIAKRTGDCAR